MHGAAGRLRTGWHSALCQGCEGWQRADLKEALSGRAMPTLKGTLDLQTVSAASAEHECGSLLWPSPQHPTAIARHVRTHLSVHSFIPALIHPRLHPPVDLVLLPVAREQIPCQASGGFLSNEESEQGSEHDSAVKSVLSI